MAGKGSKPGERRGGRKAGTPNKATVQAAVEMAASGETPKEYMLRVMRDPAVDHLRRDKMAIAAAPYFHPHLAAIQHTGADGEPIQQVVRIERVIIRPENPNSGSV